MQGIFEHGFVDCATDIPRTFRYGVGFHFYLSEMLVLEKLSGKEGHPLTKRFMRKMSTPLTDPRADNNAGACSLTVSLWPR